MKVEVVREEIKEYVLRLAPHEYRDLLILFAAPKEILDDAFTEGALSHNLGGPQNTYSRQGVIDAFKKAGADYVARRTA